MKFRMRQSWRWLVALGAVFVPAVVSGALELPFTFKAGGAIKASEVNANFDALNGKLNALSGGIVAPVIGTATIAGVLTDAPIRKFSQTIDVPWTSGAAGPGAKPNLSAVVIERDSGEGTPAVELDLCQGKVLASASIVVGNLTVDLKQVTVLGVSRATPASGPPQESISLSFTSVTYSWAESNQPVVSTSYDVVKATGGAAGAQAFLFGHFPANVTPDAAYVPITAFEHDVACPAGSAGGGGCKAQHAPIAVTKGVGSELLSALGLLFSGKAGSSATVDFFADETSISNSIELDGVLVTNVALSTDAGGALTEKLSFGYQTITWTAGNVSQGWDVAAGKAL